MLQNLLPCLENLPHPTYPSQLWAFCIQKGENHAPASRHLVKFLLFEIVQIQKAKLIKIITTLRELIFAVFADLSLNCKIKFPQNFSNVKKQRSNNSQKGSNFLSSEKSAKLSSRKKSQNCESQKLVPAKNSSLKMGFLYLNYFKQQKFD